MTQLRELTSALRHRDFRLLWSSQALSVIGDQIITVAMALFVIDLTGQRHRPRARARRPLAAAGRVHSDRRHLGRPAAAPSRRRGHRPDPLRPPGGARDPDLRRRRRDLAGGRDRGRCSGPPRRSTGRRSPALLPQTVPEAEIQEANALTTMSNNVGEFVGPALATLLVLGVGAGAAFALDAATFHRQRRGGHPAASAPGGAASRGAGGAAAGLAGGAARRLSRGPLAHLGVGDAGRVLRRGVHRPRALVRARADGRDGAVRQTSPSTAPSRRCSAPGRSSARWSGSAGARATRCGWR